MFFSEEKNQKTFASCSSARTQGPRPIQQLRSKSLLLLFFRKEGLPSFLVMAGSL
jgi:hypothetical protein